MYNINNMYGDETECVCIFYGYGYGYAYENCTKGSDPFVQFSLFT